jgi:lipoprotein-releasing system permease protein
MNTPSFPLFVALRYSIPARRAGMSSFLSAVSLLGLSLGVFALIVVISVMNGFERELQNRLLSLLPHAQLIVPVDSDNPSYDWPSLRAEVLKHPDIKGAAPYVESTVMLSANQRFHSATLTGIDVATEQTVSVLHQHIVAGDIQRLSETRYGIVIGSLLARQLGVMPGDKVNIIMPKVNITPMGPVTRQKRFEVVAVFEVGAELDRNLVISNLTASQKLLALGPNITGIRLAVSDQFKSIAITDSLLAQLLASHSVTGQTTIIDWREKNSSLFRAVFMEKIMIFILLLSVVIVASFNIVSIILMTVTDKRSDIAVLRTMGACASDIRRLFILQGLLIGFIGTATGVLLALLVAPNVGNLLQIVEQLSGWQLFDPNVYFIPYLPSELRAHDVVIVSSAALVISLFATLYPAAKAARIEPAEALAYEH